ncbi:MAG: IS1634 family transposase [bacterium]|nr:IS1634 family transposase [bacterium]
MYIRVKTTPNSPRKSVQIVESVRDALKVRQKIVRYVGIAMDDKELVKLKDLAEYIKLNIEEAKQPSLFPIEELTRMAIESRKNKEEIEESVKLKEVEAVQDVITGIHDIYGEIYTQIGFDKAIARPASHESALNRLFHIVMGRIASPSSKRDTVRKLAADFGISFSLDSVYRMMDLIDQQTVQRINSMARSSAESLFKEKAKVIFYDCTTLYFESFKADELKENGYSKDLKFNQPQVLLALMVTTDGLPLGYEVFPGSTFEGHTLRTMINTLKNNYEIESLTFVADSAMLSSENLTYLDSEKIKYIVGCRIKNQSRAIVSSLQEISSYKTSSAGEKIKEIKLDKNRIISSYSVKRAFKDAKDRNDNIERLRKKLAKSKKVDSLISNHGYKKYLKLEGSSNIELDETKISLAARFDGLHAVVTNDLEMNPEELLEHYHGLWQIEECFRISKHDLKIRPIFHWTPSRIRAHIAICFMSLVCIRKLAYCIKLQYRSMSPEQIRTALLTSKITIVKDKPTNKYYAIPSNASPEAVKIYKISGKEYSRTPYKVTDLQ